METFFRSGFYYFILTESKSEALAKQHRSDTFLLHEYTLFRDDSSLGGSPGIFLNFHIKLRVFGATSEHSNL